MQAVYPSATSPVILLSQILNENLHKIDSTQSRNYIMNSEKYNRHSYTYRTTGDVVQYHSLAGNNSANEIGADGSTVTKVSKA
jgi:hypothetical protein